MTAVFHLSPRDGIIQKGGNRIEKKHYYLQVFTNFSDFGSIHYFRFCNSLGGITYPFQDATQPLKTRVNDLLSRLTDDEKIPGNFGIINFLYS